MSKTTDILTKAKEITDIDKGWVSVGVGFKEKNGEHTGEQCMTLLVSEKKALSALSSDEIFPSTVNVNGEDINTDVVEMPIPVQFESQCYEDETVALISEHRAVVRPIEGGISMGTIPPNGFSGGYRSGCTFGGIAVDKEDNTIVGLTNNHCMGYLINPTDTGGHDPYYESFLGKKYYSPDNAILTFPDATTYTGGQGLPVFQNGSIDAGTSAQSTLEPLTIGIYKRAKPWFYNNTGGVYNKVDTAIFSLSSRHDPGDDVIFDADESFKQLNLDETSTMSWATEEEISSLLDADNITEGCGWAVFKGGRTTGPVGWPGSDPYGSDSCTLSCFFIGGASTNLRGNPAQPSNQGMIYYGPQVFFRGNTDPGSSGDSGSMVCALFNQGTGSEEWKIIAHFWGGSGPTGDSPNGYGVGSRISDVASELNLEAYTGQTSSLTSTKTTKIVQGYQNDDTLEIDGKTYYAVGITSEDPNYTP